MYGENGGQLRAEIGRLLRWHRIQQRLGGEVQACFWWLGPNSCLRWHGRLPPPSRCQPAGVRGSDPTPAGSPRRPRSVGESVARSQNAEAGSSTRDQPGRHGRPRWSLGACSSVPTPASNPAPSAPTALVGRAQIHAEYAALHALKARRLSFSAADGLVALDGIPRWDRTESATPRRVPLRDGYHRGRPRAGRPWPTTTCTR
jgi:hypothetical protein